MRRRSKGSPRKKITFHHPNIDDAISLVALFIPGGFLPWGASSARIPSNLQRICPSGASLGLAVLVSGPSFNHLP